MTMWIMADFRICSRIIFKKVLLIETQTFEGLVKPYFKENGQHISTMAKKEWLYPSSVAKK